MEGHESGHGLILSDPNRLSMYRNDLTVQPVLDQGYHASGGQGPVLGRSRAGPWSLDPELTLGQVVIGGQGMVPDDMVVLVAVVGRRWTFQSWGPVAWALNLSTNPGWALTRRWSFQCSTKLMVG